MSLSHGAPQEGRLSDSRVVTPLLLPQGYLWGPQPPSCHAWVAELVHGYNLPGLALLDWPGISSSPLCPCLGEGVRDLLAAPGSLRMGWLCKLELPLLGLKAQDLNLRSSRGGRLCCPALCPVQLSGASSPDVQ